MIGWTTTPPTEPGHYIIKVSAEAPALWVACIDEIYSSQTKRRLAVMAATMPGVDEFIAPFDLKVVWWPKPIQELPNTTDEDSP